MAPQVFQVMVDRQLADRGLGRVRLRFHVSRLLADGVDLPVEERTVHTGSLTVATPELTAVDVVAHPDLSGGRRPDGRAAAPAGRPRPSDRDA